MSIILLLLTSGGCWPPPSTITTTNITQPVLVGKIKSIGGKLADKKQLYQSNKFSASITNSEETFALPAIIIGFWGWRTRIEGSEIFDKQLLPIVNAPPNDSTTMIMVDSIRFSVTSGYWLFLLLTGNYGWLDGAKYGEMNPEHEELFISQSVEILYNSTATILNNRVRIRCAKKRESPFFSTITLYFEGVTGVYKDQYGSLKQTSLKVEKDDKFYMRTNSLLLHVEVVQVTDLGITLAFEKR